MNKLLYLLFVFLTIIITTFSCSNSADRSRKPVSLITIQPDKKSYVFGEKVKVKVTTKIKNGEIDNIKLFLNNKLIKETKETEFYIDNLELNQLGNISVRTTATKTDGVNNTRSKPLLIVSDVKPGKFRYNIVKEFPHSIHSYTQGLEFYNELLFEGTGQYGRSKIMNVNPLNGKALKSFSLRNDLFGEGITILDDKIYQLTWKNRKGFVYKLPDLIPVDSFMLQSEEGWGLTNDGTHLIMSNGSHNLLWIDPLNYKVVKFVQVANHIDVINNLNELEYIDGTIYANVFTTNIIIQIDPETGKVLNEINLDGLIDKYRNLSDSIDVLNGIAWKKADKRLFVTGKNWPRLFEIKIIPSK